MTVGRPDGRTALLLGLVVVAACSKIRDRLGVAQDRVIALEGATLIDGAGGAPKPDALIIIRNGHIETIARVNEIPVPGSAERFNLAGKTIIPGLIDSHAHVERWAAARYIAWGVTTVRDLHSDTDSGIKLRNDLNLGAIVGRCIAAGASMVLIRPVARDGIGPVQLAGTDLAARRFSCRFLPGG